MPAENGNKVKVHYIGTLNDGTEFDNSTNREPIEFTIGKGQMIAGFEKGVTGMNVGEKKAITIPADEAYGQVREDLIIDFPKEKLPNDLSIKEGLTLQMTTQDGNQVPVIVKEIFDEHVKLDANHPLAGKDLNFNLELIEIS